MVLDAASMSQKQKWRALFEWKTLDYADGAGFRLVAFVYTDDGRALWRINGKVVGDHDGPTTRNSKPIDFIMLSQIYGDAKTKHQWTDDIEICAALPE